VCTVYSIIYIDSLVSLFGNCHISFSALLTIVCIGYSWLWWNRLNFHPSYGQQRCALPTLKGQGFSYSSEELYHPRSHFLWWPKMTPNSLWTIHGICPIIIRQVFLCSWPFCVFSWIIDLH
jgi:hypothetical protein